MTNVATAVRRRAPSATSGFASACRAPRARPRLAVFRSLNHIYAQVIDDTSGQTVAAASSLEKGLRGSDGSKTDDAKRVGKLVAERAKAAGIEQVVFDRAGFKYHGRVRSLAEAAREAGLDF